MGLAEDLGGPIVSPSQGDRLNADLDDIELNMGMFENFENFGDDSDAVQICFSLPDRALVATAWDLGTRGRSKLIFSPTHVVPTRH